MKPSVLLSSLSWSSLFSLIWMILLKYIKPEPSVIGADDFLFHHSHPLIGHCIHGASKTMKLASFDIEISNELSSPGDANWPPKIACAAVALSDYPDEVKFFTSSRESDAMDLSQIHDLIANLYNLKDAGYTFLTWNGVSFDFQVIAALAESEAVAADVLDLCWHSHVDMMLLVTFQTGYRLSLDSALAGAGLAGKLHEVTLMDGTPIEDMSGARAPELWRAGERAAVLDYLKQDVIQPLQLASFIEENKSIRWHSKSGKPMSVNVPALYTVQEAYQHLPHPGYVGWMSDPIFREDYIKKYLPNVEACRE